MKYVMSVFFLLLSFQLCSMQYRLSSKEIQTKKLAEYVNRYEKKMVLSANKTVFRHKVMKLVRNGADPTIEVGAAGARLIHLAAQENDKKLIEFLLERGVFVDSAASINTTPLMYAVVNGHLDLVKLLANRGANINAKAKFDITPLMFAALNGRYEITQLLLQLGANINDKNIDGKTALDIAAEYDRGIFSLLVSFGANIFNQ